MKSRTLVTEVEVFATCFVGEFTAREQRWSRLFEQLSPIYKWVPGGLRKVQSCPRRRAALAVDRPTRWTTRGAPQIFILCRRLVQRFAHTVRQDVRQHSG